VKSAVQGEEACLKKILTLKKKEKIPSVRDVKEAEKKKCSQHQKKKVVMNLNS